MYLSGQEFAVRRPSSQPVSQTATSSDSLIAKQLNIQQPLVPAKDTSPKVCYAQEVCLYRKMENFDGGG